MALAFEALVTLRGSGRPVLRAAGRGAGRRVTETLATKQDLRELEYRLTQRLGAMLTVAARSRRWSSSPDKFSLEPVRGVVDVEIPIRQPHAEVVVRPGVGLDHRSAPVEGLHPGGQAERPVEADLRLRRFLVERETVRRLAVDVGLDGCPLSDGVLGIAPG